MKRAFIGIIVFVAMAASVGSAVRACETCGSTKCQAVLYPHCGGSTCTNQLNGGCIVSADLCCPAGGGPIVVKQFELSGFWLPDRLLSSTVYIANPTVSDTTGIQGVIATQANTSTSIVQLKFGRYWVNDHHDFDPGNLGFVSGTSGFSFRVDYAQDGSLRLRVCTFDTGQPQSKVADQSFTTDGLLLVPLAVGSSQYVIGFQLATMSDTDFSSNGDSIQTSFASDVSSHTVGTPLTFGIGYASNSCE